MKRRMALFALLTLTTMLGGCSIHWWDHDHDHQRPWYHWDNGRHEGFDRQHEGGQHDRHPGSSQKNSKGKSKDKGNKGK